MKRFSLRRALGLLLFLAAALCAAGCLFLAQQTDQAEATVEDLREQVDPQLPEEPEEAPQETPAEPEAETERETPLTFPTALQQQNPDLAAWLRVSGTGIDYPVMLTPNDPEHYLRRDFWGKYSLSGTPFLDAACTPAGEVNCLVIYGHNMRNGTMFSDLKNYESAGFYQAHPTLTLALPGETRTYQIFAALHLDTDAAEDLALYDSAGRLEEAQFTAFVYELQSRALYQTGVAPQYGQKLLLLSTCSKHAKNGRMVVVGVQ